MTYVLSARELFDFALSLMNLKETRRANMSTSSVTGAKEEIYRRTDWNSSMSDSNEPNYSELGQRRDFSRRLHESRRERPKRSLE